MRKPRDPSGADPKRIGARYPVDTVRRLNKITEARNRTAAPGWVTTRETVLVELVQEKLEEYDEHTGLRRPQPAPKQYGSGQAPGFDPTGYFRNAALFEAMDQSGLMLWACGPEMENLHVTPALEEYAGRRASEFLQHGWVDLVRPGERVATLRTCQENFAAKKRFLFVYHLLRADGEHAPIVDYAQPRFLPNGVFAGYVGLMRPYPPGSAVVLVPEQQTPEIVLLPGAPQSATQRLTVRFSIGTL